MGKPLKAVFLMAGDKLGVIVGNSKLEATVFFKDLGQFIPVWCVPQQNYAERVREILNIIR